MNHIHYLIVILVFFSSNKYHNLSEHPGIWLNAYFPLQYTLTTSIKLNCMTKGPRLIVKVYHEYLFLNVDIANICIYQRIKINDL